MVFMLKFQRTWEWTTIAQEIAKRRLCRKSAEIMDNRVQTVQLAIQTGARSSVRRIATECRLRKPSMHKIMKRSLDLFSYKIKAYQNLNVCTANERETQPFASNDWRLRDWCRIRLVFRRSPLLPRWLCERKKRRLGENENPNISVQSPLLKENHLVTFTIPYNNRRAISWQSIWLCSHAQCFWQFMWFILVYAE